MDQRVELKFNEEEYNLKYNLFFRECDRLRERKGSKRSTNPDKIKEYKEGLVRTYNDIVIFCNSERDFHSKVNFLF